MIWSIYLLTNHRNYKIYVGQTRRLVHKRFIGHCSKKKTVSKIHSAIKKYGRESFSIEVIDVAFSQNEANFKEEFWIKTLKSTERNIGYNVLSEVKGIRETNTGKKFSEVHKMKMSLSMTENRKKALLELNEKEWVVISPDGEILNIKNLQKFCEANGLDPANMVRLTTTCDRSYHKGWQCFKKEQFSKEKILPKKTKISCKNIEFNYVDFIFPNQKIVRSDNIYAFCKENSLDSSSIYKLIRGIKETYKGIRVYTPNSSN